MEEIKNYFLSEIALKECYEELFDVRDDVKKWDICILINRKGYWDYKIFFPEGVKNLKDGQRIYSDRYVEKCPLDILKTEFNGRSIRIYDDSITHGSNLFYFYLLCKSVGAEDVKPYVYACNTSFPSDVAKNLMRREAERIKDDDFWKKIKPYEKYSSDDETGVGLKEEKIESVIKEFTEKLSYKVLLGNTDIEKLSTWQTKLFQEYVSPLVMDLPILNQLEGEDTSKREIACVVLNKENFMQLCTIKTENWEYVDNIAYTDEVLVKASYFRFNRKELWDAFPYWAHDFIVKCKYEEEEAGDRIRVVFTPFAIVKSISYEKIWEVFQLFYQDTEYEKMINEKDKTTENIIKRMEEDANLCKGLFRAVIFRISHYIGLKFKEMVEKEIGIQLEVDWGIMNDNFCSAFISTEQEWENSFSEVEFLSTIAKYRDEQLYISKGVEYTFRERRKATPERISNQMRESVIGKKKSVTTDADDTNILEKRIYHFEEMENELDGLFVFQFKQEKQQMVTNSCIAGLETNSFSNYLLAKKEEHVLYRGFRYGENSEVFLHESLWFFYIFLYVYYQTFPDYYQTRSDNELVKGYDNFMRKLRSYLERKNYMNVWISEDGFEFLKKYFGKFETDEKLVTEIRRRRYLLEYDRNIMRSQLIGTFMEEAYLLFCY